MENQLPKLQKIHEAIEQAAAIKQRPCPECGKNCVLYRGRTSGKWFFKHEYSSDCIFDQTGNSIMFDTTEEAMSAKEIFNEP